MEEIDIIHELIKIDTRSTSSIYLREIALLMEEIERLKLQIKELKNEQTH